MPPVNGHVYYPTEFPVHCVTEAWRILRSGDVAAEKADLGLHLWNCQGYLQAATLGRPEQEGLAMQSGPALPSPTSKEGKELTKLEEVLTESVGPTSDTEERFGAGLSPSLLTIIQLILALIQQLRSS